MILRENYCDSAAVMIWARTRRTTAPPAGGVAAAQTTDARPHNAARFCRNVVSVWYTTTACVRRRSAT